MPYGWRQPTRKWDKMKHIQFINPSRYEQNEASVKVHWKNVIRGLELSYKDDLFWESQCNTVRELVGPTIFQRIAKIFQLPLESTKYEPTVDSETSIVPSEQLYMAKLTDREAHLDFSGSEIGSKAAEEEAEEEETEVWTTSSVISTDLEKKKTKSKSVEQSKSIIISKSLSKLLSRSFSRCISRTLSKTFASLTAEKSEKSATSISSESIANTGDDMDVYGSKIIRYRYMKRTLNPHFEMLYCNESETDMIKWRSKYKQKVFEVSASDELGKKAEILTKKIAKDFYDWWVALGSEEFKSEIKAPEDIETLFQVWFDEHASRGLMLHPKIIPCVLHTIATYTDVPKASCPNFLERQIHADIYAETSPAHIRAFGTSLPQKMKHIPPNNNTKQMWHSAAIPEDLRTMACVWDEIQHLTSTKSFHRWLQKHPNLPMPPYLAALDAPGQKAHAFVVPSDYLMACAGSVQDLALPVSQFSLELKQVLSKLMNE